MDINTVRGLLTVVLMIAFIGMVIWAWSSKRKKDFDEASRLPLDDDKPSANEEDNQHE
ncbi:MAG: cbb3-type cytochrome c oxidase subunit 3 [Gammaproteobacteria bacterium]|jgi:cytochrome c oxidase cbb3-type subunit 4